MRPTSREGDLVRATIAYLNARGAFAWRNQSGLLRGTHKGKPWAVHMGVKGMPDVLAVMPWAGSLEGSAGTRHLIGRLGLGAVGRLIAVECKRGTNKPTADQLRVHEELRKRGAIVLVAYTIADVENALA
jgi:hypothetical protein